MSNHWIFKVNDDSDGKISLEGIKIYNHRMGDKAWGIKEYTKAGRKTANVSYLTTGDRVIFYLCGNEGHRFLGTAILKTGFPLVELVIHKEFLDWKWGVKLVDVTPLARQVKIEDLRGKVHFVPEGENYGSYIQGAITKISEEEYNLINNLGSNSNVI